MKLLVVCFLFLFLSFAVTFAEGKGDHWLVDLEQAKELSKKENKNILLVFSGSDWCIACIKLKKLVLDKQEFLEKAEKDFVLLNIDFPSKKENALSPEQQKKNDAIAEKYNPKGFFPLVVVLNSEGETLLSVEKYQGESVQEYLTKLEIKKEASK